MSERTDGVNGSSLPAEKLFEQAWEEIETQLATLRRDLDLADRSGLGDETKQVISKKLSVLQKAVDEFASRWIDFERRRKGLEERITRQG